MTSAEAQVDMKKRQRFPGGSLGVNCAWGGYGGLSTNGPLQSPTITVALSAPLPVFYQQQGEIQQAEAQHDSAALQQAKMTAQMVSEVSSALAAFATGRKLVERMEGPRRETGGILESAKGALDAAAIQYEKGAASLTDFLDALRTYIAIRTEYFGDLANYWIAVFQVEQAVGMDLR